MAVVDRYSYRSAPAGKQYTTPPLFSRNGKMHIDGDVNVAAEHHIEQAVNILGPLFSAAEQASTILLGPLPMFYTGRCCPTTGHCTNGGTPGLRSSIRDHLPAINGQLRRYLDQAGRMGISLISTAALALGKSSQEVWGLDSSCPKLSFFKEVFTVIKNTTEISGNNAAIDSPKRGAPSTLSSYEKRLRTSGQHYRQDRRGPSGHKPGYGYMKRVNAGWDARSFDRYQYRDRYREHPGHENYPEQYRYQEQVRHQQQSWANWANRTEYDHYYEVEQGRPDGPEEHEGDDPFGSYRVIERP